MRAPQERDYVVGTHDAEIERLGLQHHLWRHRVFDCWRRAKLRRGYCVADIGAGPGYASLDLADLIGPTGHVHAVEHSRRFLSVLIETIEKRRISSVAGAGFGCDSHPPAETFAGVVCPCGFAGPTASAAGSRMDAAAHLKSGLAHNPELTARIGMHRVMSVVTMATRSDA